MTPPSAAEAPLLRLLGEQGGLLTAGEAAARTGLPLEQAERGLLALAVAAGADLRVGQDGSVAYRFPRQLRRRLLARSWRRRLVASLLQLWRLGKVLLRLSIGTVLLLLVLVVGLILLGVGLVQLLRSDDGIEAIGQLLLGSLEGLVQGLASLRFDRRTRDDGTPPAAPGEWRAVVVAFLNAAFSVLFGDGDPNSEREQRRWSRIGCFLRHRHGAVIAEDLSPLLDLPLRPGDAEQATALADAAMLPVLLRFDGRPEVNDQGDLAYHFPALQVDAAPVSTRSTARKAARELPSPPLLEQRLRFSRTTSGQRWTYFGLSTALLVLAPMLFDLIRPTPAALAALGHFAIGYALLLLLLPLLRLPFLHWRNRRIERRNRRRRSWARPAGPAAESLERRRRFARTFARRRSVAGEGLAYTTEEGLLEQQIAAAAPPMDPG